MKPRHTSLGLGIQKEENKYENEKKDFFKENMDTETEWGN